MGGSTESGYRRSEKIVLCIPLRQGIAEISREIYTETYLMGNASTYQYHRRCTYLFVDPKPVKGEDRIYREVGTSPTLPRLLSFPGYLGEGLRGSGPGRCQRRALASSIQWGVSASSAPVRLNVGKTIRVWTPLKLALLIGVQSRVISKSERNDEYRKRPMEIL